MLSAANLYTSSLDNIFPRAASIESKYLSKIYIASLYVYDIVFVVCFRINRLVK